MQYCRVEKISEQQRMVVVEYKNDCGELVTAFPSRSETGGIGDVVYKRESKD